MIWLRLTVIHIYLIYTNAVLVMSIKTQSSTPSSSSKIIILSMRKRRGPSQKLWNPRLRRGYDDDTVDTW